jgi:predicted O-linked N-acetylglucosamine transferase (SPINDLY family)
MATAAAHAKPGLAVLGLDHADALKAAGRLNSAREAYATILEHDPENPGVLISFAELLLRQGDVARAQLLLMRACAVAPKYPPVWALLGLALHAAGDWEEAEAAFAEAASLEPTDYAHAMGRMGAAFAAGHAAEELSRLEAAWSVNPLDPVPLTVRGALLERLGRHDEAADLLEAAVLLAPEATAPALELANTLMRGTRAAVAEAALARAIALLPDQTMLRANRAVVLTRLHRHREAVAELRAVMDIDGATPLSLCNLSTALTALGEQDDAVAASRRACALAPSSHLPYRSLMSAIAYQDGVTAATMVEIGRHAAAALPREDFGSLTNNRDPNRRIRIGLLSQTLKCHPVGWLTVAAFEHLDAGSFEIVCLGQIPTGDPIERRFRALASSWIEVERIPPKEFAASLRALDLDVLIELSGYGDRGMMPVCASRIAPVQVKWVGMQNHSTALPEMDWFITDRWETPDSLASSYTERLMYMPDGYVVYSPPVYAPDVAPLPALEAGAITFGSFNNIAKVTPRVIETWSRILRAVPDSRLVLKTHQMDDPPTEARLRSAFGACGVDDRRIELRGRSPHRVLLQQYNDIDIVLDPFPYVGGLTTCEALWMGVPTVTLAGETFSSRHAASHMSNVGLADWVAENVDEYCRLAGAHAADVASLAVLRKGMRRRVKESPLCDGPRFGRHLGERLRAAWREWCRTQR